MSDLISRQHAIEVARKYLLDNYIADAGWHADGIKREIESLPSAETPTDLISRESVLAEFRDGRDVYDIMESIEQLPSAEPTPLKDGTLMIAVKDVDAVKRVIVKHHPWCKVFYE